MSLHHSPPIVLVKYHVAIHHMAINWCSWDLHQCLVGIHHYLCCQSSRRKMWDALLVQIWNMCMAPSFFAFIVMSPPLPLVINYALMFVRYSIHNEFSVTNNDYFCVKTLKGCSLTCIIYCIFVSFSIKPFKGFVPVMFLK